MVDLTISPDWDARLCYGVVFLCAMLSARTQVLNKFAAQNFPSFLLWRVPHTWLIYLIYLCLPLALFWFMDRVGALSDTSLFSALLVGLAYPAILAGGFGGLKAPAGLDGLLKPLTVFVDSVVKAVNRKLARNEQRFEDYIVGRMVRMENVFQELRQLAESTVKEPDKLKQQLDDLEAKVPKGEKLSPQNKEKLTRLKARAIYLRLSALPDFIETITRNKDWIGRWYRSPIAQAWIIGSLAVVLLLGLGYGGYRWLTQPNMALRYHVWRLGKVNNSAADRNRARAPLKAFLQETNRGPGAYQSIMRAMRAPGLPAERVDLFLQLALHARAQSYHDQMVCSNLVDTLQVENVDARVRIHQVLIYLAEKRDTDKEKFKIKEKDLADWNPTAGDSVPNLEKRMDQWRAFFGCGRTASAP
jgi:hypothetical protein